MVTYFDPTQMPAWQKPATRTAYGVQYWIYSWTEVHMGGYGGIDNNDYI